MSFIMHEGYVPSDSVLNKYAKVLVNFALNSGNGLHTGEVVRLQACESAKPLYVAVRNQILRSGGHCLTFYSPDDVSREFFELSSIDQLKFFPKRFYRGLADDINHSITIISESDKRELEGIEPQKIMTRIRSAKPFKNWLDRKEANLGYTWTLAAYGTPAMAKEAGLSLEAYWDQIIKACFLDHPDPVAKWREIFAHLEKLRNSLNRLRISRLHIEGEDADLWITIGADRQWLGGSGRNIPSFEIFTSPDWRGTDGWIRFNQPLYRYGSLITNVFLRFVAGVVVESHADINEELLKQMISVPGANRLGEFSLTDSRISRIDHFMAETLYDENISGPFGNTHIALGSSYHDCYSKKQSDLKVSDWRKLGFNDSAIHTDIISTTNRTVSAILASGERKVIYSDGRFLI